MLKVTGIFASSSETVRYAIVEGGEYEDESDKGKNCCEKELRKGWIGDVSLHGD